MLTQKNSEANNSAKNLSLNLSSINENGFAPKNDTKPHKNMEITTQKYGTIVIQNKENNNDSAKNTSTVTESVKAGNISDLKDSKEVLEDKGNKENLAGKFISKMPILFVKSFLCLPFSLRTRFEIRNFGDFQDIEGRYCYLFDDPETSEAQLRHTALTLCRIQADRTFVYKSIHLLEQFGLYPTRIEQSEALVTEKEFTTLLVNRSVSYEDWARLQDQIPLSIKEATKIAMAIYKVDGLSESTRKIEIATLAKRVETDSKAASYQWGQIVADLEKEFNEELIRRGLSNEDPSIDVDEQQLIRLNLSLLDLVQENNRAKYYLKRAKICSYFRLSKIEVEELAREISDKTVTQESRSYSLDELLLKESEVIDWLVSEILPKGEMVVLAGMPKCGKTMAAMDIAFSIITGGTFLGLQAKKGKVLLISNDESSRSTRQKAFKRGFTFGDGMSFRLMHDWDIEGLYTLEKELAENNYDLVIIDSLKSITSGNRELNENSAEFANNLYQLKNLFSQYNCSSILLHHTNKNRDAAGVYQVRGSSAIAGAAWGVFQMDQYMVTDPADKRRKMIDPKDPRRIFTITARDIEGQIINAEINPENCSFDRTDKEVNQESLSLRERITQVLLKNQLGLSGREIIECLNEENNKYSIYSELGRMEDRKLISTKKSTRDKRVTIYTLKVPKDAEKLPDKDSPGTLPTSIPEGNLNKISETIDVQGIEDIKILNEKEENNNKQQEPIIEAQQVVINVEPLPAEDSDECKASDMEDRGVREDKKQASGSISFDELLNTPEEELCDELEEDNELQELATPKCLVEVAKSTANLKELVGRKVEVRSATGRTLFIGTLKRIDSGKGLGFIEVENGGFGLRKAYFKEIYVYH